MTGLVMAILWLGPPIVTFGLVFVLLRRMAFGPKKPPVINIDAGLAGAVFAIVAMFLIPLLLRAAS